MTSAIRAALLGLCLLLLAPAGIAAMESEPAVQGHQLLFIFDTRADRTTFFIVSNPANARVQIDLKLYGAELGAPIGQDEFAIPAFGNTVINPGLLLGGAQRIGLAVVTPILPTGRRLPVVPREPLVGVVTRANTAQGAAHGDNPLGRMALQADGTLAAPGSVVDGTAGRYESVQPSVLAVPGYYDPTLLGPPSQDGNQLVLIAFEDRYDGGFSVAPATQSSDVSIFDASGSLLRTTSLSVSGVEATNLQELAGPEPLRGSGKLFLDAEESDSNLIGSFSMALGQFGGGARLPSAAGRSPGEAARVVGDQLLFPVDATGSRAPFVLVTNPSSATVFARVDAYPAALDRVLSSIAISLEPLGNLLIDPTDSGGLGLDEPGLLVVTPIASAGSPTAVVPPDPLLGQFTQADLNLGEAFGENPFGRHAVRSNGTRAAAGATVDGSTVRYERLDPPMLIVPGFFNPDDLGGPDDDGNRLTLVAFEDRYDGGAVSIAPGQVEVDATITDSAGRYVARTQVSFAGLHTTTVQTLADSNLDGSGKVFLEVTENSGSVFGVFSMALLNFGVGLRLPPVDVDDLPTATPTPPAGLPTPTPGPGNTPAPGGTPTPPIPTGPGQTPTTPSPTPSPTPAATPSPTPSPTPGCRNGIVDDGEECDHGDLNMECSYDDAFRPSCEPARPPRVFSCAYCEEIYDGGFAATGVCPEGSHRVTEFNNFSCLPGDEKQTCNISVQGQKLQGLCPEVLDVSNFKPGDASSMQQAPCSDCVPENLLEGDCPQLQQNVACTLDINGTIFQGTCQDVGGALLCVAGWKP